MQKLRYEGRGTPDGKMKIWNKDQFFEQFRKCFAGKDFVITIAEKTKGVSKGQRGYWYAVVVKMVQVAFNDLGNHFTLKQIDKMLIDEFFFEEHVNEKTGTIHKIPLSFEQDGGITTKMFNEKKEQIQQWAAQELEIYIPDPSEQIKIEL